MKQITILLLLIVLFTASPVMAQTETPYIIRSTKPISTELRGFLDAWLATDSPSDAPYYIVTYTKQKTDYMIVSLVGVDLASPELDWNLTEDPSVWMGTVKVYENGVVNPLSFAAQTPRAAKLRAAAGGGSYVAFPWEMGKNVMYGPRGVHGDGDYGTSGLLAVDFVSGTSFGPSAADDNVYASDAGVVDYVCEDTTSTAIRTHNTETGDYFVYAHILANDNLDYDVEFAKGELIGSLKHGSFDDTCGWAEQGSTSWHVHWMFQPASGSFRAEDCRLTVSTERWDCNGEDIGTGEYLYGGGGAGALSASGLGTASGGTADTQATFWDYFLGGIIRIMDTLFFKQLPEHGSWEFLAAIYNAIDITFTLVQVMLFENLNIYPLIRAIQISIGINLLFALGWLAAFLLKAWKSLVPILGA
jgi:hypothetical protein